MKNRLWWVVGPCLLIAACSSSSEPTPEQQKSIEKAAAQEDLLRVIDMSASSKNVDAATQLSEAATSVSESLNELTKIQEAREPITQPVNNPSPQRLDMAQIVSVDWTGELEPLLKKIAKTSKYRLRFVGTKTALPIIVSVHVKHVPLADVVEDVRYQASAHGQLVVDPKNHVLEFRYSGA